VVSPVTAVVSAFLPVLVGVLQGERLGVTALVGAGLATAAIFLVSTTSEPGAALVSRGALLLALGAGAAIALQLIALHQSPTGSGVTPLLAGRVVSGGVVLAAFLTSAGPSTRPARASPWQRLPAASMPWRTCSSCSHRTAAASPSSP